MKLKIAAIGSFVPTGAAVVGSVALSLLVLHPPPAGLFPGTAPADRGHVASLALPAPPVSRPHATTQIDVPRPTPSAIAVATPRPEVTRPEPHPSRPTHPPAPTPPPVVTVPTPVTQPVTTPVTTPTVRPPTATPANNGRWSSPQTKVWKGQAVKQALRVEKGKPPWAGPKKGPPPPTATTTITTITTTTTVPAAAPDTPTTPPGQAKTPPGQAKKAKSPHG